MLTTHIALALYHLVIFTLPLPPTFFPSAFSSPLSFTCRSMFLASMIAARLVGLLLLQAVQEKMPRYSLNYIRNFGWPNTGWNRAHPANTTCLAPSNQPRSASPFGAMNQSHCLPTHQRNEGPPPLQQLPRATNKRELVRRIKSDLCVSPCHRTN